VGTFTFDITWLEGTFTHCLLLPLLFAEYSLFSYTDFPQRFAMIIGKLFAPHNLYTESQPFAGRKAIRTDNINHIRQSVSNIFGSGVAEAILV
jgi:hypothetical protein